MNARSPTVDDPRVSLSPGDLVDRRYRLVARLGSGGMGEVWSAHHEALGRTVAIKVVFGVAPEMRARLAAEARAIAKLSHPAVVAVYDAGALDDGRPFLVLELVVGESLADRLDREGPPPAIEAVRLLSPVARALAAAHEVSIVHRDVKPANVLLVRGEPPSSAAKLADFGIASSTAPDTSRLTAVGGIVGTPAYMAPEQLRSQRADGRADVWGLSVTLFEVVTGNLPFVDDAITALILKVLQDEPVWASVDAVDEDLGNILRRGLAKEADARYGSATELAEALDAWLAQESDVAPAPRSSAPTSTKPSAFDALIRAKLPRR